MKKLMGKLKGEAELVGAKVGAKAIKVEHAAKGAKKGLKRGAEDLFHEPSTQKQLERGLEDMFDDMTQGAEKLKSELKPGFVKAKNAFKEAMSSTNLEKAFGNLSKEFSAFKSDISKKFGKFFEAVKNAVKDFAKDPKGAFVKAWKEVKATARAVKTEITKALSGKSAAKQMSM